MRLPALLPHLVEPDLLLVFLLYKPAGLPGCLAVGQVPPLDVVVRVLAVSVRHLPVNYPLHRGVPLHIEV